MELGMIGFGRMGAGLTARLISAGHRVVVFDRSRDALEKARAAGAAAADRLASLVDALAPPRHVWVMVPAGDPTESVLEELAQRLGAGDVVVDGGNSHYRDTLRRASTLGAKRIHLVDAGTSGGVFGLEQGYSLMVGGAVEAVERLRPILESLAPARDEGWGRVGPSGSGHFVKMIHNGIEYGLMQAYAEGFEILKRKEEFHLDLHQIAQIWRSGSVVRSWLLDLTALVLAEDQNLDSVKGFVADSGEGRWTVAEAIDLDVPAPIITSSLLMRLVSRQDESYAAKLLASLRNRFGGHAVRKTDLA
jgi:6-phosphogluconate dehydrogenase